MKKIAIGIFAIVFMVSCFLILPQVQRGMDAVEAAYRNTAHTFRPPAWESGEIGRIDIGTNSATGLTQQFALQGRYFNAAGTDITDMNPPLSPAANATPVRTVFSQEQMEAIQFNALPLQRTVTGSDDITHYIDAGREEIVTHNFGMIMVDNNHPTTTHNNFVMLELLNMTNFVAGESWFDFRAPDSATTVQTPWGGFSSQPAMNNTQLRNHARAQAQLGNETLFHNNAYSVIGMFRAEGWYRFSFRVTTWDFPSPRSFLFQFGFYIVHSSNYASQPNLQGGAVRRGVSDVWNYRLGTPNVPFIVDNTHRFETIVESRDGRGIPTPGLYSTTWATNVRTITFDMLGTYNVRSRMIFMFNGVLIPVLNFDQSNFNLNVFGFQAYFEKYDENDSTFNTSWFGVSGGVNADISHLSWVPAAVATTPALADAFRVNMQTQVNNQWGLSLGHRPVTTNTGPVQFVGNGLLVPNMSTVSFNNGSGWQAQNFIPNRPFDIAGEYIVTLYYTFAGAEVGFVPVTRRQVFHFRIVSTMDIRVAHMVSGIMQDIYHINDFVGGRIPISGSFLVFMDGMEFFDMNTDFSPFMMRPSIELTVTNFNGTNPRSFEKTNFTPADWTLFLNQFRNNITNEYHEGNYTFRVFYGRNRNAVVSFTVIVDNTPVQDFNIINTGGTQLIPQNAPNNLAIWGAGTDSEFFGVELHWGLKPSGISFTNAQVEVFNIERNLSFVQASAIGDVQSQHLVSPYWINPSSSILNFRVVPIIEAGVHIGYRIDQRFSVSGIYVFSIIDNAGIVSRFVLIIDNTSAAFAQNPPLNMDYHINMVIPNVTIGFGRYKVIAGDLSLIDIGDGQDLAALLATTNIINAGRLSIPMRLVERTTNVNEADFVTVFGRTGNVITGNHHEVLSQENFFTYRSFDHFGNMARYYIFVNSDMSRGVVLSDSVSRMNIGQTADSIVIGGAGISPTASIVRPGGISNREFINFTFLQRSFDPSGLQDNFTVDRIELTYFPKTFERFNYTPNPTHGMPGVWAANPNYPFSQTPSFAGQVMYQRSGITSYGMRAIPVNQGPIGTLPGMYMITRHFIPSTMPGGNMTDLVRNYFFIVDPNPIIAPLGTFESDIRVRFGDKVATYDDFQKVNNHDMRVGRDLVIQTNMNAHVYLPQFNTKYGRSAYAPDGTQHYLGDHVMSISHSTRNATGGVISHTSFPFESLRLSFEVQHSATGELGSFERLSDRNATNADLPLTDAGFYRLVFTDGSAGMRWQNLGMGEQNFSPNRSEILFERTGMGANGMFFRNGRRISLSSTQFEAGDVLTFSYTATDPRSFFADVATTNVTRNGTTIILGTDNINTRAVGTAIMRDYTFPNIANNDIFAVTLNSVGNIIAPDTYTITIDNTPPQHNLNAIKFLDRLWQNDEISQSVDAGEFIFSLPSEFMFTRPDISGGNPLHDAHSISFFEVYPTLAAMRGEYNFTYNYYRPVGQQLPFSQIIRPVLASNDNRFFRIVERDEAGNITEYFVNLRGSAFTDHIEITGMTTASNVNNNLIHRVGTSIFGTNVTVTNVNAFWRENSFFEISTSTQMFRRLGDSAIFGNEGSLNAEPDARPFHLYDELNRWLLGSRLGQITLTINNGFNVWTVNVFQIDSSPAHRPVLSATSTMAVPNGLIIRVENWQSMPLMFLNPNNNQLISVQIFEIASGGVFVPIDTFNFAGGYTPQGWQMTIANASHREILIVLTDLFGRTVRIEHNGYHGNHRDVRFHGNTSVVNGIRHTGDSRGVIIEYTDQVHEIRIFRDGDEISNPLASLNVERELVEIWSHEWILRDVWRYTITPPSDSVSSTWRIIVTRMASGTIDFDQTFRFYTNMPEMRFTNLSGDPVLIPENALASQSTHNGMIEAHFESVESIFGSNITFTRSFFDPEIDDWREETQSPRRGQTRFIMGQVGIYTVTVQNEVWASRVFRFIIEDIDNTSYRVFFDYPGGEEELAASPNQLPYTTTGGEERMIPHYFVRGTVDQINILGQYLHIELSLNYPRFIVGDAPINTLPIVGTAPGGQIFTNIFALESVITGTRIYIAVTSIAIYGLFPPMPSAVNQIGLFGIGLPAGPTNTPAPNSIREGGAAGTYALFTNIATSGLPVSITRPGGDRNFNAHPNNVVMIDYYFEGVRVGTFRADENITIYGRNYGTYEFVMRDVAGFRRIFQDINAITGETRTSDRFTIYNLSRAPVTINGEKAIGGMVYNINNDSSYLTLGVMQFENSIYNDTDMFVTQIRVWRNGDQAQHEVQTIISEGATPVLGPFFSASERHNTSSWQFDQAGTYIFEVQFRYRIGITVHHRFSIQIVDMRTIPTMVPTESFVFVPTDIMTIESIRRGGAWGAEIIRQFCDEQLRNLRLDSDNHQGYHLITVRIDDGARPSFTKSFSVDIRSLLDLHDLVRSNIAWGTSTNTQNGIVFVDPNIAWLFPNSTFSIYRNGVALVDNVRVSAMGSATQEVSGTGIYRFVIRTHSGNTIFSQGFEIEEGMSTIAVLFIFGGIAVVLVGIALFFIMRNRMKVK